MAACMMCRRRALRCGCALLPTTVFLCPLTVITLAGAASEARSPGSEQGAMKMTESLVSRIDRLKKMDLPDEWFSAKGSTLSDRFEATFRAMPAGPDKPGSVAELVARYGNNGEPFQQVVWLNQPLRCPLCKAGGADGFRVVASVRNNLAVRLSAEEMHLARTHQQAFTATKLVELGRLLADPDPAARN